MDLFRQKGMLFVVVSSPASTTPHWCCPQHYDSLITYVAAYPPVRFLGAFAKLRKATISFVTFVCPSVSPSVHTEQIDPLLDGFS